MSACNNASTADLISCCPCGHCCGRGPDCPNQMHPRYLLRGSRVTSHMVVVGVVVTDKQRKAFLVLIPEDFIGAF